MFKDHTSIMHELRHYASPKARLTRMIRSGEVIQLRRGMFLDKHDTDYSIKSLASIIYGPSYVSFEYALAFHNLIPERAVAVTCAVYKKNKNRTFHTPIGDFFYYYLPAAVYPHGIMQRNENGKPFLIASPEKALCDTLYKTRGITTLKALESLLFEDWRMERADILALDRESINFLAPLYKRNTMKLIMTWFEGAEGDE